MTDLVVVPAEQAQVLGDLPAAWLGAMNDSHGCDVVGATTAVTPQPGEKPTVAS
ncbi:hypothetical protein [Streptomyces sp. NPDC002156]